jgi:hypothetical protein
VPAVTYRRTSVPEAKKEEQEQEVVLSLQSSGFPLLSPCILRLFLSVLSFVEVSPIKEVWQR